jgi:alginate O-acetyltransferase complex protein AlgJ
MIQPAELSSRLRFDSPIPVPNNPDYPRFIAELRAAGVDVFDPTPAHLIPGQELYLRQDTHWTPQWMEQVAAAVADHVKRKVPLPPAVGYAIKLEEAEVSHIGDIADSLHLPERQSLFPRQAVKLNRVLDAKTNEPRPRRQDADVLVLGDSFTNIYSAPQMLWGDSAGFSEQISRFLNRDVDVIARNGLAAETVRAELAQRESPLKGKRVIIWEVTMHELTCSHWPVIRFE